MNKNLHLKKNDFFVLPFGLLVEAKNSQLFHMIGFRKFQLYYLIVAWLIIDRSTFGQKYPLEGTDSIGKLLEEVVDLLLVTRIGEFIPWLSWIDRVRGLDKRAKVTAGILDEFLEGVIQQHLQKQRNNNGEGDKKTKATNFIDVLLDVKESDREIGMSLSMENIKVFLWVSCFYISCLLIYLVMKAIFF